jgi:hypothetical protein
MKIENTLTQLETAQLVRRIGEEEATYMFKHTLTQDAAYQSLLIKQRREIHRLTAQAYEILYADRLDEFAPIIAQHCAGAEDDAKAVEYSIRAGDVAARIFANTEARLHYHRALDTLAHFPDTVENHRRRIELALKCGEIAWGAETPEQIFNMVTEAERLARTLPDENGTPGGDRMLLSRIHYQLGSAHLALNQLNIPADYYQQVLIETEGLGYSDLQTLPYSICIFPRFTFLVRIRNTRWKPPALG